MSDKMMHAAFAEAYAALENPRKNASNPAFKSKYANLEEMLNVTRPVLAAEGFCLVQEPVSDEGRVGVRTRVIYRDGESIDFGAYTVSLAKNDPQGAGSAITYCRRYAIAAIFGLAQEDDDGNDASGVKPKPAAETPEQIEARAIDADFELTRKGYELAERKAELADALGNPKNAAEAKSAWRALTPEQRTALRDALAS